MTADTLSTGDWLGRYLTSRIAHAPKERPCPACSGRGHVWWCDTCAKPADPRTCALDGYRKQCPRCKGSGRPSP